MSIKQRFYAHNVVALSPFPPRVRGNSHWYYVGGTKEIIAVISDAAGAEDEEREVSGFCAQLRTLVVGEKIKNKKFATQKIREQATTKDERIKDSIQYSIITIEHKRNQVEETEFCICK